MKGVKKKPIFYDYCRITVYLPVSNNNQKEAARKFVAKLKQLYSGLTYTSPQQSQIIGFWSDKNGVQFDDSISIVMIDLPYIVSKDIGDIGGISDELKAVANSFYRKEHADQIEFWVTVSAIMVRADWTAPNR